MFVSGATMNNRGDASEGECSKGGGGSRTITAPFHFHNIPSAGSHDHGSHPVRPFQRWKRVGIIAAALHQHQSRVAGQWFRGRDGRIASAIAEARIAAGLPHYQPKSNEIVYGGEDDHREK